MGADGRLQITPTRRPRVRLGARILFTARPSVLDAVPGAALTIRSVADTLYIYIYIYVSNTNSRPEKLIDEYDI